MKSTMTVAEIDGLIGRMTWEEKLGQLQIAYRVSAEETRDLISAGMGSIFWQGSAVATNAIQRHAVENTRLRIPLLVGLDVIHGQRTIFPTPLALAGSFDPSIAEEVARISAEEAASGGVNWTFSPMVDVSRDARWGRIVEGFGEDVLLNEVFGAAMVRGYQGKRLSDPKSIAACAKHYVGYGQPEGGRDYNTVDASEYRMRNVYLPPFRAAVRAGAASIMASFNTVAGIPSHANRHLLTEVLRDEWGSDAVLVGDAEGVANLVPHGVAGDIREALVLSLGAGLDMEMGGNLVHPGQASTLKPEDIDGDVIDRAVARVLRLKLALGLFDHPYVDEDEEIFEATVEHRAAAREIAAKSIVLLKNDDGLLPLAAPRRILVTGPYASSTDHLGAWVQSFATHSGTISDELRAQLPDSEMTIVPGAGFYDADPARQDEVRALASEADVVLVFVGEPSTLSGEAASRSDLRLTGDQEALIHAVADSGVPFVVVLENGRPLVIADWFHRAPAILEAWHLGTEAPHAIVAALTGKTAPSGKLPASFPRHSGQTPIYYSHENTGRPARTGGSLQPSDWDPTIHGPNNTDDKFASKYLDLDLGPLLPFGFGLTYTAFAYSEGTIASPSVSLDELRDGRTVDVSCSVTNVGDLPGEEVVQLYVRDLVAHRAQPIRVLRRFTRVELAAGEERQIDFVLGWDDLGFWSEGHTDGYAVEPGEFEVFVGGSSEAPSIGRFVVTPVTSAGH